MSERERFSIDPETIAALLDGRLRGEERERVLAAIDASPELLAIVGDAAEARELASPVNRPETQPIDPPAERPAETATIAPPAPRPESSPPPLAFRRTPRWIFTTLAAAAVVIVVVGVPLLTRGGASENSAPSDRAHADSARATEFSTTSVVGALTRPAATSAELPATAWGTMRGTNDGASNDGHVIRVGARLADAQMLNAAGDTALHGVAAQIAALLENFPGGSIEARAFRQIAAAAPGAAAADSLRDATAGVELMLPGEGLHAGAWLETLRVASQRGDSAFFSAPVTAGARSALSAVSGPNRPLADSLVSAVSARPRDMTAINDLSTRLLAALAR